MRASIGLVTALVLTTFGAAHAQEAARTVARFDFLTSDGAALSPDGRYAALGAWERGLLVVEVASGRNWTVLRGVVGSVDWSPRGDHLAFTRWDEEAGNDFVWTMPIDAGTGRAAGEARRVSVSSGDVVAFSPDGASIAFADYTAAGRRIVVLPTRGGRERALADTDFEVSSIAWSDDGQWIYYAYNSVGTPKGTVARVALAGGPAQIVWETAAGRPMVIEPGPMIVQPEAGRAVPFANSERGGSSPAISRGEERIRVLDGSGRSVLTTIAPPPAGELTLSAASADGGRLYGLRTSREFRLLAVSVADGSRRVLDSGPSPQVVATGITHRIAFRTDVGGALGFTVILPDGTGRREYRPRALPTPQPLDNRGRNVLSPDGRRLAYVSLDTLEHLMVLDLESGEERALASGATLRFRWTSNDALQVDRIEDRLRPSRRSVHRVGLDGRSHTLRVISDTFRLGAPEAGGLYLENDTMAMYAPRDREEIVPIPGGMPRVVFRGPTTGGSTLSPDGRYLAVRTTTGVSPRYHNGGSALQSADAIAIVDLETGRRRDLELEHPAPWAAGPAVWHPDGRHLVLNLAPAGSQEWDTYLLPINGDRPRLLVRGVRSAYGSYPILIDDGNTVLVTVAGPTSTDLVELTRPVSSGRR